MKVKDELVEETADIESRRSFFTGLGKWSAVVIGGILMGTEVWAPKKSHACDFCVEEPTPRKPKVGEGQPTVPGATTPTKPRPILPSPGDRDIKMPERTQRKRQLRKKR